MQQHVVKDQNPKDCAETVEEGVKNMGKENAESDSEEEVEYIYEIEYVEETEDEDEQQEDKQHEEKAAKKPSLKEEPPMPVPILMRSPSTLRKSVSFSPVHSVLTEDNQVIFVDEDDDIFK